jgi:predicted dehydrogenase
MSKNIRVGVVGLGRGETFARGAAAAGMELVALCDANEAKLREAGRRYDVAAYTDYRRFLEHDMDAVVLANYFHQHAPFAIEALRAGKHVMSETSACKTIGEGVALCREVEKSGKVYFFAENYPFTAFNQEMRRLYRAGEIGDVLYAEGEYNHPMPAQEWMRYAPGLNHWRNLLPPVYYNTHALAPLMYVTDAMPVSVNCLSIVGDGVASRGVRVGDLGFALLCRMDNGAVFRLFGLVLPGHSVWYRFHGTRGAMESLRGPGYWGPEMVRIVHEPWDLKPGDHVERIYKPDFPEYAEEARRAGHGGGDFFTNFHFARAIRTGEPPWFDVYRGVATSCVGILGWKSALENGKPFVVPDFRDEAARRIHENDHWSPFPEDAAPGQPPPSILGIRTPSPEAVEEARRVWADMGHTI